MTTLYDEIYDEVALGIERAERLGYIDKVRANELREYVSDWIDLKKDEDDEIAAQAMTRLFRWGDEADQAESMQQAGHIFSSESKEGMVL